MATISNLFINQGTDFSTIVTLNGADDLPLDLTGYTALSQIRKSFDSSTYTDMSTAFIDPRSSGQIQLSLTNTQTTSLEWGRYVWDLVITDDSGTKTRVVEGIAMISPSVSRN